jgi:hypothetical protein
MTVYLLNDHETLRLAADELARCLQAMTGVPVDIERASRVGNEAGIYLATGEQAGVPVAPPEAEDTEWDDGWTIRSVGRSLVVAGVNPRSTLIASYEYLRRLGAEWLWPGPDGECLPRIETIPLSGFDLCEGAASRHRGVCIEGAPALEHVLDMVEWLPRVGMNAYFLQFQVSSYFWRQWYRHDLNPTWTEKKDLTEDECAELDESVVRAVKQRDLLLHRVGHGWTAAALNLPTNGWDASGEALSEETRRLVAEVGGRRELWGGVPINTELCYSHVDARRRLVGTVLEYASTHPDVDVLHFWLSDAVNNHCECAECSRQEPSDWYVTVLNELSRGLREVAPKMKLAFLAYLDTLWPPRHAKLDLSHGNLVYMFAPISRCYGHNLCHDDCGTDKELERPPLNRVVTPEGNLDNQKLLQLWGPVRPRDSFAYDYHFMVAWLQDLLTVNMSELVPADVADYRSHDVDGIVNCCSQRAFYPNGWAYYSMARALWGKGIGPDDRRRYFALAYGKGAPAAFDLLEGLEQTSGPPVHSLSWWDTADEDTIADVLAFLVGQEKPLSAARDGIENAVQKRGWELLLHYRQFVEFLCRALLHRRANREDEATAEMSRAEHFLRTTEPETEGALDTFLALQLLSRLRQ